MVVILITRLTNYVHFFKNKEVFFTVFFFCEKVSSIEIKIILKYFYSLNLRIATIFRLCRQNQTEPKDFDVLGGKKFSANSKQMA